MRPAGPCRAGRSYKRDLAEAQVPSTFGDSLPSSHALALAQQLFVLGGLIPFETIKRLFRHFCPRAIGLGSKLIVVIGVIKQPCLHRPGCCPFRDPPGSSGLPTIIGSLRPKTEKP
jgi:hypothetical protein